MTTGISLERIVQLRVPVLWHEAVAVTQEVAQRARSKGVVGLDTCWLSPAGAIEVVGKSRRPFEADPATETLDALLDVHQAPRELVTLLESHKSEGKTAVGGLANELNFFARPDTTETVAALATRALEANVEAEQQAEFERLRADAAESTPQANQKKKDTSRRPVPPLAVAAAALTVVAVVAAMAVGAGRTDTQPAAASEEPVATAASDATQSKPPQGITSRIESLVDKGLERLGLRAAEANAATPEPANAPVGPKPVRRRAAPSTLDVTTTPLFVLMPPTTIQPSTDVEAVVNDDAAALANPNAESADTPLQPPVLRWPQLPEEPGNVQVDMQRPYLELLINELGTVDKVRLRALRSTYHDKMLVSAAKAWVFHPAQKNGRPVKYLMKVPIIHQ